MQIIRLSLQSRTYSFCYIVLTVQPLQHVQDSSCNILQPTLLPPAPSRSSVLQLNTNPHSNNISQGCYAYPTSQPIQCNSFSSPPRPDFTCYPSRIPPQSYAYGMSMRPLQCTQPVWYCSCYNCSQPMQSLTYNNKPAVPLVNSPTNVAPVFQAIEPFRPNLPTVMKTNSINLPFSLVEQQQSPQPQIPTTRTNPLLSPQPKQPMFQPQKPQTIYYPQSYTVDTRMNLSLNQQPQPQNIIMRNGPLPQTKTTIAKTKFMYQNQPQTKMTANIFVPPPTFEATVRIEPNSLLSIPSLQESLGQPPLCYNNIMHTIPIPGLLTGIIRSATITLQKTLHLTFTVLVSLESTIHISVYAQLINY